MNVGDLVNFTTNSWVFQHAKEGYCNPGIIIEDMSIKNRGRYRVMWADQKITVEHVGYLKLLSDGENKV